MNQVDDYIATLEGKKKACISELVDFMREAYPDLSESIEGNMPTYRGESFRIAFVVRKNHLTFYTSDLQFLSLIKELLPGTGLGKSCAKIKYSEEEMLNIITDVIKEIVSFHKAQRSSKVNDIKAAKKWANIPQDIKEVLVNNVYCANCSVTKIVDYGLHDDQLGLVLKGKCEKCGKTVARFIESD